MTGYCINIKDIDHAVRSTAIPVIATACARRPGEHIFTRFDHTHLNEDTVVFNIAHGGVNPSVENIARVCFELLSPGIRAAAPRADRRHFTVWKAR